MDTNETINTEDIPIKSWKPKEIHDPTAIGPVSSSRSWLISFGICGATILIGVLLYHIGDYFDTFSTKATVQGIGMAMVLLSV